MITRYLWQPLAILSLALTLCVPASGQSGDPRPTLNPEALPDGKRPDAAVSVETSVAVVTDYRFRGVSLSNNEPALQAGVELSTRTGLYVGTWSSTIPDYSGAHAEVDAFTGYRHIALGWQFDVGAIGYLYPSGKNVNGYELYGSASRELAGTTIKAGVSYTPQQSNFGNGDGAYLFAEVTTNLPNTPFTLRGHLGHETGVNAGPHGDKIDWLISIDAALGPTTASLGWIDTNVPSHAGDDAYRSALIASLAIGF